MKDVPGTRDTGGPSPTPSPQEAGDSTTPCPVGSCGHLPRPLQSWKLPTGLSGRCILAMWQGPGLCPVLRPEHKSSQYAQSPHSATEKPATAREETLLSTTEKRLHSQKYVNK